MNKFKKAPLLIAALFLVLSSCVNHPRASSSIINGGSDSTVINSSSNNPASSSGGGAYTKTDLDGYVTGGFTGNIYVGVCFNFGKK